MRLRRFKPLRYLFKPHNYTEAIFSSSDEQLPPEFAPPSDPSLDQDSSSAALCPPLATRSERTSLASPPERRPSTATITTTATTTITTTATTTTTPSYQPPSQSTLSRTRPAAWPGRIVIIDEPSLHAIYPRADLGALLQLVAGAHAAPVAIARAVVLEAPVRASPDMEFVVVAADGVPAAAVRFEVISLLMSEAEEARQSGPRTVALVIPPDPHYALPVLLARRAGCDVEIWLCGKDKEHGGLAQDLAPMKDDVGLLFVHCVDRFESMLSGRIAPHLPVYHPMGHHGV